MTKGRAVAWVCVLCERRFPQNTMLQLRLQGPLALMRTGASTGRAGTVSDGAKVHRRLQLHVREPPMPQPTRVSCLPGEGTAALMSVWQTTVCVSDVEGR